MKTMTRTSIIGGGNDSNSTMVIPRIESILSNRSVVDDKSKVFVRSDPPCPSSEILLENSSFYFFLSFHFIIDDERKHESVVNTRIIRVGEYLEGETARARKEPNEGNGREVCSAEKYGEHVRNTTVPATKPADFLGFVQHHA